LSIVFEALGAHHDRAGFSCGNAELDDRFRRRAGQDDRRDIARVFVAMDSNLGIVGFYSLSAFRLDLGELPAEIARKLPKYENGYPAALIGRLARDVRMRGKGFGDILVADAIKRILGAARAMAVLAITVDAKDERAAAFYQGLGFKPFPSGPTGCSCSPHRPRARWKRCEGWPRPRRREGRARVTGGTMAAVPISAGLRAVAHQRLSITTHFS
jgi:GNAT superfamily N-acetyltransferase